jgi:uncharacterized protein (TIGR02588 family)
MKRNVVEWAVLGASIVGIVVLAAVLISEGISEARPPDPTVEVRLAEARQGDVGWIVPATVSNGGGEAAEAVVLEATATVDGQEETSELEVNFLPAGTTVEVAFGFSARPSGEVVVRLVGFRVP